MIIAFSGIIIGVNGADYSQVSPCSGLTNRIRIVIKGFSHYFVTVLTPEIGNLVF